MDTICGILGVDNPAAVKAMAAAMRHRGDASHMARGPSYTVASSAPLGEHPCAVDGRVRGADGVVLTPDTLRRCCVDLDSASDFAGQGAFAAVVDLGAGERWWLIRDRVGVKPLYYYQGDGFLLFASEMKGILASGLVDKHLNLASVDRYFTLRCVPGPETVIQGVNRVRPGHVLVFAGGEVTEQAYVRFVPHETDLPREEAANRLAELLKNAMGQADAERLLWSSGVDCAALAAIKPGLDPLFVKLRRVWQDEERLAEGSARLMGLDLDRRKAKNLDGETFARIVHHLDEPIADASVLPLWLIMEQAGKAGQSFVSGHGADELLGGYPRYHFLQKTRGARRRVPVNLLGGLIPSLPPNAFVRRGAKYLTSVDDNIEAYLSLLAVFQEDERAELYTDTMNAVMYEKGGSVAVMRPHFVHGSLTRNLFSLDLNVGLPSLLLAQCDRLAAAHGVELEFPYLDEGIIDFAASLPAKTKFGVRSKPVLRAAMKGHLPGAVRLRARRGFHIPQEGPVVRVLERIVKETITAERVESSGLFKWPVVQEVVRAADHNVYRRRQFWALLMFLAWHRRFMEG